jgi:hypothetical protein
VEAPDLSTARPRTLTRPALSDRQSPLSAPEYSKPFIVSAEHERISLVYDDEVPKTHRELQRLPDEVKHIAREIAGLVRVVERSIPETPPNKGPQADT